LDFFNRENSRVAMSLKGDAQLAKPAKQFFSVEGHGSMRSQRLTNRRLAMITLKCETGLE
jgi:hypothetical protein